MTTQSQLDHVISRLLLVKPETQPAEKPTRAEAAENAMSLSFLFTGVRCILQYAILPFVLPVLGITGNFSTYITLAINVVAIIALISSIRHLWRINYARKWTYLAVGTVAFLFLFIFAAMDVVRIFSPVI